MKEALGIALSSGELQVAYLVKRNGRISIRALESKFLYGPSKRLQLESHKDDSNEGENSEFTEVFGNDQSIQLQDAKGTDIVKIQSLEEINKNDTKLYSFLNQFPLTSAKVALNLPLSMVTYHYTQNRESLKNRNLNRWVKQTLQDKLKKEIQEESYGFIHNRDGSIVGYAYDSLPPLLEKFEQIQTYRGEKIHVSLMDTTEIALLNLVRYNYKIPNNEISAIIYIENDSSRIVFLKGNSLLHCSDIINESVKSSLILDIIYSKIIYEQDQHNIPELKNIFLAGKCLETNAHIFFDIIYSKINIQYIYSTKLENFSNCPENIRRFSEYALPISLAWKSLEQSNNKLIQSNLLPSAILDRQKVLKLAYHSYILLALLAITSFFFAWKISTTKAKSSIISQRNKFMKENLVQMQPKVDDVYNLLAENDEISLAMSRIDSVGKGYDRAYNFLQKLNEQVKMSKNNWITEIRTLNSGFRVRGVAMNSGAISSLTAGLENVDLKRVINLTIGKTKVYEFEFEAELSQHDSSFIFGPFLSPETLANSDNSLNANAIAQADSQVIREQAPVLIQDNQGTNASGLIGNASQYQQATIREDVSINKNKQQSIPSRENQSVQSPEQIDHEQLEENGFTIYTTSYLSVEKAQFDADNLTRNGLNAKVVEFRPPNKNVTWYRVSIGDFENSDQASDFARMNQGRIGNDFWIGKLN